MSPTIKLASSFVDDYVYSYFCTLDDLDQESIDADLRDNLGPLDERIQSRLRWAKTEKTLPYVLLAVRHAYTSPDDELRKWTGDHWDLAEARWYLAYLYQGIAGEPIPPDAPNIEIIPGDDQVWEDLVRSQAHLFE